MTREEAIDRLMWLKGVPHINDDKWIEAVDMAIEALSEVRCNDCKWNDDVIEVVRCKDCRHRVHDEERGLYYCEMYYGQGDVSDENFCQWGERREE